MENDNDGRDKAYTIPTIPFAILCFAVGFLFYRIAYISGFRSGSFQGYHDGNIVGFGNGYEHGTRVSEHESKLSGRVYTGGYRGSSGWEYGSSSDLSEYARQARESEKGSSERESVARGNETETGSRSSDDKSNSNATGEQS